MKVKMKEGGTKNDNDTCKSSTKWRQGMGGRDRVNNFDGGLQIQT